MFGDNDDDFDKAASKMLKTAIVGYIILFGVIVVVAVGFLYLIKVWFYGGF